MLKDKAGLALPEVQIYSLQFILINCNNAVIGWLTSINQGFIRKYKCITIKYKTNELGTIYFHNLRILSKEKRCHRHQSGRVASSVL